MPAKQSTSNYVFNTMLYCFLYAQIEKLTRFPELEVLKDKRCYPADRLRSALVFALSLRGDPNGATRESSGRLGIPPYRPAPPITSQAGLPRHIVTRNDKSVGIATP